MAIMDGPPGSQADVFQTVWDLAEGFALLARAAAPTMPGEVARSLAPLITRLQHRALLLERRELSDVLVAAGERVALRAQA